MMFPIKRILFAALLGMLPGVSRAAAYDESVHGDLANDRLNPTPVTLSGPSNVISGTVIFGDRDYFKVNVLSGLAIAAILLERYDSSNGRAFLGVQAGTTFTADPDTASPGDLLGYTHFGFENLTGEDLLDNLAAGPGAIGFIPPLGPGDYTFWVNQTEPALTGFQLNFVVIPEPGVSPLIAAAVFAMCARRQRSRIPRSLIQILNHS